MLKHELRYSFSSFTPGKPPLSTSNFFLKMRQPRIPKRRQTSPSLHGRFTALRGIVVTIPSYSVGLGPGGRVSSLMIVVFLSHFSRML